MPWNCQSLQHIASYCRILHQSKNSFLSPSSSQVQNSAKLPVQHHFSTIRDLQAAVLAFKPFLLSPHACGPHATSCNLWKLTQGSLTPRPPLDYLNAHLTSILQHSVPKQEQFSPFFPHPPPAKCKIVQNCQFSTIWKLILGSLTTRTPLDYLKGHYGPPPHAMELPITAAFCEKARTIFSHLLSFSSSQLQNCQFSNVQQCSAPFSTPSRLSPTCGN